MKKKTLSDFPAAGNLLIQGDNLEHTRHMVFVLSKVSRSAFRHRRRLLPKPARRAWKAVVAVPTSVGFGAGVYASVINRL